MACTKADRSYEGIPMRDKLRSLVKSRDFEQLEQHAEIIRNNHIGFYDKDVFGDGWWEPHDRYYDPLHEAVRLGDTEMVTWLLELGCPVMAVDNGDPGETAMHAACRTGNLAICQLLYEHDARLATLMSRAQETPLTLACANGHLDIVKWLVKTCGVDANAKAMLPADAKNRCVVGPGRGHVILVLEETLPLFQAVFHGHFDVADWLVAEGNAQKPTVLAKPDIYELDTTSDTYKANFPFDVATEIVHYAGNQCKWHILKWLFERRGVDPNCRANTCKKYDSWCKTPLTYAAYNGNTDCVRYLLTLPNIDINKMVYGRMLSSDGKDYKFVLRPPLGYIINFSKFLYTYETLAKLAIGRGANILMLNNEIDRKMLTEHIHNTEELAIAFMKACDSVIGERSAELLFIVDIMKLACEYDATQNPGWYYVYGLCPKSLRCKYGRATNPMDGRNGLLIPQAIKHRCLNTANFLVRHEIQHGRFGNDEITAITELAAEYGLDDDDIVDLLKSDGVTI